MRRIALSFLIVLLLASCSSVDCPLYNTVMTKYVLGGEVDVLADTLTISSEGTDSILLNHISKANEFLVPISYHHPADVLYFKFEGESGTLTDTVTIEKTNTPHFESVECSPTFFHTIDHVSWTRHAIDSIVITKAQVDYDTTQGHLLLYLKRGH